MLPVSAGWPAYFEAAPCINDPLNLDNSHAPFYADKDRWGARMTGLRDSLSTHGT